MANTPVLSIPIDDSDFKAFVEKFEEFKKHLEEMPEDWKKVHESTRKAIKTFEAATAGSDALLAEIAGHTKTMADHLKSATTAQKNFHRETRGSANELKKMATYAKSLGGHIFGIGKFLFKIGALGGGLSLLGGFGLRELGESAVRRQSQARGIGLTPGQVTAWNTDIGKRYLGLGAVQSIVGAQVNSSEWGNLITATQGTGIPFNRALSMHPDKLAFAIAQASAKRWNSESNVQRATDPFLRAQASLLGGTPEIRRLAAAQKHHELSAAWKQYQSDQGKWNFGNKTAGEWYAFIRELTAAGHTIDNVLTKKLAALGEPLSKLIKSLTTDGVKLINDVLSKKNINALKAAINDFTSYLGSKQFQSDFKSFEKDVKLLFKGVKEVADGIAWLGSKLGGHVGSGKHGNAGFKDPKLNPYNQKVWFTKGPFGFLVRHQAYGGPDYYKQNPLNPDSVPSRKAFAAKQESKYGLPKGLLWGVYGAESGYGKNAGFSSAGALGPYQWMAASAPEYGVTDRKSFRQSGTGAARYFQQALRKYHGNIEEAIASYNWGYGNLDRDIKAHGKKWLAHAPAQTQREVRRVMKVVIDNKAGSNVAVSTHAAAY